MSDTAMNFDANTVKPASTPDPVPFGKYRMHAIEGEIKKNSKGTGKYLKLTWQILDGEYKGRLVWDQLNIQHPDAKTQEIAQGQLSAICHATGILRVTDAKQLLMRPIIGAVGIEKGSNGYRDKNKMRGYSAIDGSTPATASPAGAAATTPAAPASTASVVPPWAQKAG